MQQITEQLTNKMIRIQDIRIEDLPDEIEGILSDIDDTLTLDGKMIPQAFEMLQTLQKRGIKVVLVTGRPAGWVDHIARMWPVEAVVGENGGLWFYMKDHRLIQRFLVSQEIRQERAEKLRQLGVQILKAVPGTALASDQHYRELDLAIDFCEDVPRLGEKEINKIVELFDQAGAVSKVSSIHVNGWFGEWDKLTGCIEMAKELWQIDLNDPNTRKKWVYFGDSANDEPMFKVFPYTFGVANIRDFLARMSHHPTWICEQAGGYGFVEACLLLLGYLSAYNTIAKPIKANGMDK